MNAIIEEALRRLKSKVEEIAGDFACKALSPRSLAQFEHKLFESLGELGRNVEKAVLEDADIEKPSIEIDGQRHYWKYKGPQEYQCLFGKIEVRRSVYQANGERTVCPLEVNAGILHHHLTPPAAEFVAYSTAHMVPAELAEFCRRWQFLEPSETVIKLAAAEVGELAEVLQDSYEEKIHKQEGPAPEGTTVLAVSRDGTNVNIRGEGWRQAQVGSLSFYAEKPEPAEGDDDEERRQRLRTVYLAQMPDERTQVFDGKFEAELAHALGGLPERALIACIADGARSIWTYFEGHPQLKHAVHINDFYHAAEHLSDAADALFGKGTEKAKAWFVKYRRILKLEDGGVEHVIRTLRYYKRSLNIRSGPRDKVIRKTLRYFSRNQSRMKYAEYRRRGLPIGSGVVEAACKTVVGHRLKRAGMRWSIEGGQSILNLRTLVLSERWDGFWQCHEATLSANRIPA